jgi:sulfur carrier protein ThiS
MDVETVKIGRVPGEIKEYALNGERTVGALLKSAKITVGASEVIRVNGDDAEKDTEVCGDDTILVLKPIKGAR